MPDEPTTRTQIPTWLDTPPDSFPQPPVGTRLQELPFSELSWENFERLCVRLARLEADVEHCQLYGTRGQQQHGIDLYARHRASDGYCVYQCKRETRFTSTKIKSAVNRFLDGRWFGKTSKLVLCTSENVADTKRAEEVETQRAVLSASNVEFAVWDSLELSLKLKEQPLLVDDFFGRVWVEQFCGADAAKALGLRLDGVGVADFRERMRNFYSRLFNHHDPGLPFLSAHGDQNPLPIEHRFVLPDIEERRIIGPPSLDDGQSELNVDATSTISNEARLRHRRRNVPSQRRATVYEHRQRTDKWLATRSRTIILGGPGSGKSSLLRFLVTDLLKEEPTLHVLAEKWGQYLPVWIPFGYWTKKIASQESSDTSLNEAIEKWLSSWGEERLYPLVQRALEDNRLLIFVDGLDEYTDDSNASLALARIQVFAEQRDLPVIATSRHHGFHQLNVQTAGWDIGTLSDFSLSQQEELARIWFTHWTTRITRASDGREALERAVQKHVESFGVDLRSSADLKELAKIPLLLSVLLAHKLNNVELPPTRFKAYESLIDHLLFTHPKARRRAAQLTTPLFELNDKDMKLVLASLAFRVHQEFSEGIFGYEVARAIIIDYLRDTESGFALDMAQARKISGEVLQIGENTLGLIVKKSHSDLGFFHRAFQEYLAAIHLSTIPLEKQLSIVDARCIDPQWREPILALLYLTSRSEDVEKFVNRLREKSVNPVEQFSLDLLLGEIAFGDFNCGAMLARGLAKSTVSKIEVGSWMPHRERLLRQTLEGLRSTKVREFVKAKVFSWFPDRTRWNRYKIFRAMSNWEFNEDLMNCLFKGLYDETSQNARAAGRALAASAKCDEGVGGRVANLAWAEVDPVVRACAIECLLNGWPEHSSITRLLATARNSTHPVLRLVGISGKVLRGEQAETDLQELFFLGSFEAGLDYDWRERLVQVLVRGWGRSDKLKRTCLDALEGRNRRDFSREVAKLVLVDAFPQDDDVGKYFAEQLSHEYFSVPVLYPSDDEDHFFDKLARNFKDHPLVAPAADSYCQRNLKRDYLTYYSSALVGRSQGTKALLLSNLLRNPSPIVPILLKGWGNDSEVRLRLTSLVFGPNKHAAAVADQIPKVVDDKEKARARLLELLHDTGSNNKATVIAGLIALADTGSETEIVDLALKWLADGAHESVSDILIRGFSFNPRVRELAKAAFAKEYGDLALIASVYGSDSEIKELLIKAITPLPAALRATIANRLNEGLGDDEFVLSLLGNYNADQDNEVKVEAALGYYNRLKSAVKATDATIERLRNELQTEFDMQGTRQAAFCGLVILGRLDVMKNSERPRPDLSERRIRIPITEVGEPATAPFLKTLLQNWDYVHDVFREEFWFRFGLHSPDVDSRPAWRELCLFADEYSHPREEAIAFFEERKNDKEVLNSTVLSFLDRVVPRSRLLLDYCMGALRANWGKPHYTSEEALFAVELLGKHFAGDKDALARVMTLGQDSATRTVDVDDAPQTISENLILALCEGWPRSVEMRKVYETLCDSRQNLTYRALFQLASRFAPTEALFRDLRVYLRRTKRSEMMRFEGIARFIVRRLNRDEEFVNLLLERLGSNPTMLEKAALPRLVALARGPRQIRQSAIAEIEKQLDGTAPPDIGVDIIEGKFRPMVHSLLDAINLGATH